MFKWLGVLGSWQGYAAAAGLAALLSIGATYYLVSMPYKLTISRMETEKAQKQALDIKASLDQLQTFIANMHSASAEYGKNQDALFAAINKVRQDFAKVASLKPLPVGCAPDPERVRILTEAITAANAAASGHGFGETVRSDH